MRNTILLIVLFSFSIFSQQQGGISGLVTDQDTKQLLTGVTVKVLGTNLGTITDAEGKYSIAKIEEGVYRFEFSYVGYSTHQETDVRVVRDKISQIREVELAISSIMNKEVTIKAGLFDDDLNKTINTFGYNRDEILRTPGSAGDIFRAIETLPGVSSAGGEFNAFSVRGGGPKDNIVLVDNIPFDRISHFDRGNEDQEVQGGRFSIFTPGVIDAATFQGGGFSARHGGKNSSIVDLKVREGNYKDFMINGTYDVLGWEVNYDGPSYIDKNTSILFSARKQDFKNILNWTGQKDMGDPSFMDVLFKITTNIGTNNKLSFIGIFSPELYDRNINHVYESDKYYDTQLVRQSETKRVFGFNWRALLSNTTYFVLTGYYKNKDVSISLGEVRNDPVNGVIPKKENATIRSDMYGNFGFEEEFGTKFELNHQFAKDYSLSSGFEINSISAKYDFVLNTVDTIFTFDRNDYRPDPTKQYLVLYPAMLNNIYDDKSINGSAFTEFTGTLFDGLTFNLGGRYEYAGLSKTNYFSPRFSFAYYFTPNLRFNFATGVYYQAPDFLIITELNANKSLKNEKSTHIIGGLTSYLSDEYKLTVEGYYKDFTDLIVRADRTSPLRVNGGKGWSAGIDISVVKRLTENWYGQVNYSYSQSQRDDNLGEGWYNSDFNQPNIFNILVGYEFNKEWAISLKWKYATGRPLDSYIVHGDVFNDPNFLRYSKEVTSNNTRRFDDFHTLNVRVDYRLQIGKFAMVMFLDIGNIYSRLNVNEERFIYRDGSIVKRGYEISPTFGMKVEF